MGEATNDDYLGRNPYWVHLQGLISRLSTLEARPKVSEPECEPRILL